MSKAKEELDLVKGAERADDQFYRDFIAKYEEKMPKLQRRKLNQEYYAKAKLCDLFLDGESSGEDEAGG